MKRILNVLISSLICVRLFGAENQKNPSLFKVSSGKLEFEVLTDAGQPYWVGYHIRGKAPAYFMVNNGSEKVYHYDKTGVIYGIISEGLSVKPSLIDKTVSPFPDGSCAVIFKANGEEVEVLLKNNRITLSRLQAIEFCEALARYWERNSPSADLKKPDEPNGTDKK
jgi:hypothetical protein